MEKNKETPPIGEIELSLEGGGVMESGVAAGAVPPAKKVKNRS